MSRPIIPLGTKTLLGTVSAVKSGSPRDYLLIKGSLITWLDELALIDLINKRDLDDILHRSKQKLKDSIYISVVTITKPKSITKYQ